MIVYWSAFLLALLIFAGTTAEVIISLRERKHEEVRDRIDSYTH